MVKCRIACIYIFSRDFKSLESCSNLDSENTYSSEHFSWEICYFLTVLVMNCRLRKNFDLCNSTLNQKTFRNEQPVVLVTSLISAALCIYFLLMAERRKQIFRSGAHLLITLFARRSVFLSVTHTY